MVPYQRNNKVNISTSKLHISRKVIDHGGEPIIAKSLNQYYLKLFFLSLNPHISLFLTS